jgi:hypothetical protein
MLQFAVPPGYQRQQPIKRPKLDPWLGIIDAILRDDKQRPVPLQPYLMRLRSIFCQKSLTTSGLPYQPNTDSHVFAETTAVSARAPLWLQIVIYQLVLGGDCNEFLTHRSNE